MLSLNYISCFHNTEQPSEILILKIEMLLKFPEFIAFLLMHFGFSIESSDIDL